MKAIVVTTITSTLDIETGRTNHTVAIDDCDSLVDASRDVLGAVVMGGLNATRKGVADAFPLVAKAERRRQSQDEGERDALAARLDDIEAKGREACELYDQTHPDATRWPLDDLTATRVHRVLGELAHAAVWRGEQA